MPATVCHSRQASPEETADVADNADGVGDPQRTQKPQRLCCAFGTRRGIVNMQQSLTTAPGNHMGQRANPSPRAGHCLESPSWLSFRRAARNLVRTAVIPVPSARKFLRSSSPSLPGKGQGLGHSERSEESRTHIHTRRHANSFCALCVLCGSADVIPSATRNLARTHSQERRPDTIPSAAIRPSVHVRNRRVTQPLEFAPGPLYHRRHAPRGSPQPASLAAAIGP